VGFKNLIKSAHVVPLMVGLRECRRDSTLQAMQEQEISAGAP